MLINKYDSYYLDIKIFELRGNEDKNLSVLWSEAWAHEWKSCQNLLTLMFCAISASNSTSFSLNDFEM